MTKKTAKVFVSIMLIILGNTLIFPLGFVLELLITYWIPQLNNIYLLWVASLIAAVPMALMFVFARRLYNHVFMLDVKRYVALTTCALPSFAISIITSCVMYIADVSGGGMDFSAITLVAFLAIPYTAVCILVISAALWVERVIEKRTERQ